MPENTDNNGLMPSYFNSHEIQRSYNYLVKFLSYSPGYSINEFQVKNVALPNFAFKKEIQKVGGVFPQIFPVLDSDGLELKMEIEEDNQGKIAQFILGMQQRIIDPRGYYQFPNDAKIGDILIQVVDQAGNEVIDYVAKECFFLKNEEVKYTYSEQYAISYMVTFGFSYYEYTFHKAPKKLPSKIEAIISPNRTFIP